MKNFTYNVVKRIFDIIASAIGIIGTSPLWLIAIIGIELSDPGPIFYKARRVVKDNREVCMFKFRSMRVGNAREDTFRGDVDRIFAWGKIIRELKIDELPQLINIFLGTMSVVGPRPAAPEQAEITRGGEYAAVSVAKAGLTGPSALYDYIYGDAIEDETEYAQLVLPTRLKLDLYYIKNRTVFYDLKMIIYTVVCILMSAMNKKPNKIYNELVSCASDIGSVSEKGESISV